MEEAQSKVLPVKQTINCRGKLIDLSFPKVMGIINVTPDSFFDGGALKSDADLLARTEQQLEDGATFIDIGAMSSRPKSEEISESEELNRLLPALESVHKAFPEAIISADTYRSGVAKVAIEHGASIINDISAGHLDPQMIPTIGKLGVPYIMMHMQGTPQSMQDNPTYDALITDILDYFLNRLRLIKEHGILDVIVDPGFGFGKTLNHNYEILDQLSNFKMLGHPILAGLSRKSMINKVLETKPSEALNGTTALNMVALQNGANILRVHDVKEAHECIKLYSQLNLSRSLYD